MIFMNGVPDESFFEWALCKLYLMPIPTFLLLSSIALTGINVVLTAGLLYGKELQYFFAACLCVLPFFVGSVAIGIGREKGLSCK